MVAYIPPKIIKHERKIVKSGRERRRSEEEEEEEEEGRSGCVIMNGWSKEEG